MKRIREDVYVNAGSGQFKRPYSSSRVESYGQSQTNNHAAGGGGGGGGGGVGMNGNDGAGGGGGGGSAGPASIAAGVGGGNSQKLTTDDALSYLREVKEIFHDQKAKYDMFLEVMKDFKAQRTDTAGVIARVKELFKGHNNLIFGFNTFLPKGYEITLDEDESPPKKTVEFEEAISFVNKIKKRFQNDEQVYKTFLDILNMYRKEHKDINEVYSEVSALFENHPDLLDEFTRFLPDNSATTKTYIPCGKNSIQRYNERNSTAPTSRMQMDKQRRRDKIGTSHAERDPSVDRPEMDDDRSMLKLQKEQRRRAEKETRDGRNRDLSDREPEHDSLQHFPDKKKSARKVEGFEMNSNFASYDDKDGLKSMYNEGFIFCEKVKEKLGSSDDYQAFLKCLNIFSSGIIKRNDLQNLVTDLLGKYPDLMEEFNYFLERCENIDGFLAGVMSKKSLGIDGQVSRPVKVEDKEKEQKRELDGAKEKERCKEKYMWKSIQELDLSDCETCTPSYRLLPDDYPIPIASQRSELGAQVLNDLWVSVTSGSEDYSFKHMRRNQYEESLFRCEDDRFELDMLLESVSSAAKTAEELLKSINENKMDNPIRIEDHFSALNIRCIERLYGDHGLDVVDVLRKNPSLALPVILTRLKQKQEEWTRCRADFNKVWAEIYAKNHYKSLDHRSFYFKQQDSKNLSTKSLVAEIKEVKEKQQKEDDFILAFAAGNRLPVVPNLEYEYSDASIHEDLYKLVQYSCEEVCSTKDQLNKVMRLWTTFMEPMLGIVSHPSSTDSEGEGEEEEETEEKVEEEVKEKDHPATNGSSSSLVENGGSSAGNPSSMNLRQPKSANNGNGRTNSEQANFFGTSSANGDSLVKQGILTQLDFPPKDDLTLRNEREHKDIGVKGGIAGVSLQTASDQGQSDLTTSPAIGVDQSHGRHSIAGMIGSGSTAAMPGSTANAEEHKVRGSVDAGPSMEGPTFTETVLPANGAFMDGTKAEKEEGELSPNGDYGGDNFVVHDDTVMLAMPMENHDVESGRQQSKNEEALLRQNAISGHDGDGDADDEDSENASEVGEDASGSESAGDECSNEEEDDAEHDEGDGKAESEGEAEGTSDTQSAGADVPLSERFLSSVKPVTKHVPTTLVGLGRKDSRVFYGNDDFYVLFRLHQTLYERILSAKTNSTGTEVKWRTSKDAGSVDPYARFMRALYDVLDGSIDNSKFEDECRAILGNQSYVLFTLDKLVYKLVKQLQTVATDEVDIKLLQLYDYEKSRKYKMSVDFVYYDNARFFLHEENIYRLEFSSTRMSIQLMDNVTEKSEVLAVSMDPSFAAYLYNDYLSAFSGKKEPQGIILNRNKAKYANLDEISALSKSTEGVKMLSGLECKIACNSCKISYVLDTEDVFYRLRRKRKLPSQARSQARMQRYQRLMLPIDS